MTSALALSCPRVTKPGPRCEQHTDFTFHSSYQQLFKTPCAVSNLDVCSCLVSVISIFADVWIIFETLQNVGYILGSDLYFVFVDDNAGDSSVCAEVGVSVMFTLSAE